MNASEQLTQSQIDVTAQTGPVFWSSEALARMSQALDGTDLSPVSELGGRLDASPRSAMPNLATPPLPHSLPPLPAVKATAIPGSEPSQAIRSLISLDGGRFVYEPYPIVSLPQMVDTATCREMLAQWPPQNFFANRRDFGSRYTLSEQANGTNFAWYVANTAPWSALHDVATSRAFVENVLATLAAGRIDTGLRAERLQVGFEFSMLAGNGGHMMPHTDPPGRMATIEIFIGEAGSWDPAWGGGLAMLKPTDIAGNYNVTNRPARFEEMTCLETFPCRPGSGVIVIKTFNSHRAVYPMTAPAQTMRRSIVITLDDRQTPAD
ncbi:MAG: hypothetical protein KDA63_00100 [Planctomycetales bacterium]|nr:hypothetical protein [Planctomycetales bacterium]